MKTYNAIAVITLGLFGFAAAGLAEDHKGCELIEKQYFKKPSQHDQAMKYANAAASARSTYPDKNGVRHSYHTDVEVHELYDITIVYVWKCPDPPPAVAPPPGPGGAAPGAGVAVPPPVPGVPNKPGFSPSDGQPMPPGTNHPSLPTGPRIAPLPNWKTTK